MEQPLRVVMPCPAPQKPHAPTRPTAVSKMIQKYCPTPNSSTQLSNGSPMSQIVWDLNKNSSQSPT